MKLVKDIQVDKTSETKCYHCGEPVLSAFWQKDSHEFCCNGCLSVYSILSKNNLCEYYQFDNEARQSTPLSSAPSRFDYLDNQEFLSTIVTFSDNEITNVTLEIPSMHCSSCIWLIEHFHRINSSVVRSDVNFKTKKAYFTYNHHETSLKQIAEQLALIGYAPYFALGTNEEQSKTSSSNDRKSWYRIGLAGFVFGNVMMLSFPDYFALSTADISHALLRAFQWLSLILSIPVLLYSAEPFFTSAYAAVRSRNLNVDAPIALAVLVTFLRSAYEIITETGGGYLDSMSGIIFFMLIGRAFQDKTIKFIRFNHDYKSYFPVSVSLVNDDKTETPIQVNKLRKGMVFKVYSGEWVPADSILISGECELDYSFVTGESKPIRVKTGQLIYAGARISGPSMLLEVVKPVNKSHLVELWNNKQGKSESRYKPLIDRINQYFTPLVFAIAIGSGLYWLQKDMHMSLNAFTAVLIVVCPCILLLASTFANGATIAILGKNKFYLQNSNIIEALAKIDTLLFDKTGTLTEQNIEKTTYKGVVLSTEERGAIRFLASQSAHPLSMAIKNSSSETIDIKSFNQFNQVEGMGIEAEVNGMFVRLGNRQFIQVNDAYQVDVTKTYVSINGVYKGEFRFDKPYRQQLEDTIRSLNDEGYKIKVISGDNATEKEQLGALLGSSIKMSFNQSPLDKKNEVEALKNEGRICAMIGDGLNDAGALLSADVGIAVSDDTNRFTPASKAIIHGGEFAKLPAFLKLCKSTQTIIVVAFSLSLIYNAISLYFAVQGLMKPVIAAIIMPATSITMIVLTTLAVRIKAYQLKLD